MTNLAAKSFALRRDILDLVYRAKTGHIGGDFSVVDILTALYYSQMNVTPDNFHTPGHDRFLLSKGHSVEALYAVLADRGFFPKEELESVSRFGSPYIGHPTCKVAGVEMCSGSLGHGLSVGAGMALAARMDGADWRVFVVMGDGELAEGSVWEGAMLAGHYKLDSLIAIVDRNGLQISGPTEDVMSHENLRERWAAFGWQVLEVDGNDLNALDAVIAEAKEPQGSPTVIIARTVKGCGVSFMENKAEWHHRVPTPEEYQQAVAELSAKEAAAHEKGTE